MRKGRLRRIVIACERHEWECVLTIARNGRVLAVQHGICGHLTDKTEQFARVWARQKGYTVSDLKG